MISNLISLLRELQADQITFTINDIDRYSITLFNISQEKEVVISFTDALKNSISEDQLQSNLLIYLVRDWENSRGKDE